jgi:hypothetical protein
MREFIIYPLVKSNINIYQIRIRNYIHVYTRIINGKYVISQNVR